MNILQAMNDDKLFARWFAGDSWLAWRACMAALFGLPMSRYEARLYREATGRTRRPTKQAREGWVIAGRRAGKSLVASLVAVYLATFKEYTSLLARGERATVMLLAADRRQARVVMRYICGFIEHTPLLHAMVVNQFKEAIELNNGVTIEVHTANFRSVRGYTIAAAICDELAFWKSDDFSANPDTAVIGALRPALATIPSSLLLCISSPYARQGALWDAYQKHFGKDGDGVLVWQAPTHRMNPMLDQEVIAQAYEDDEASAAAEYGGQFRRDIESYISREAVESCTGPYIERGFDSKFTYRAFADPAGGSGKDSYTLAIGHSEGDRTIVDCLRETRPKFDPEATTAEYARLVLSYGVHQVKGDHYAGDWPAEQFRKRGVTYQTADKTKSELYVDCLPLFNSRRIEIPNNQRLIAQICGLERRTGRGTGKDSIDSAPNGHEDLANCVAGLACGTPAKRLVQRIV